LGGAWDGETASELSYIGYVEGLVPGRGLSGWVAGPVPNAPPEVCLVIAGEEIARVRPHLNRPDIWENNQLDFCTGFLFRLEQLLPLLPRADISPAETFVVMVAGTPLQLPMGKSGRVADLVALLQASQPAPVVDESLRALAPHLVLDTLMRRASRLLLQPQRTDQGQLRGMVEQVGLLSDNLLLISGWMHEQLPSHLPVVLIAEGQKFSAGLSCLRYARPDLPAGSCGFLGCCAPVAEWHCRRRCLNLCSGWISVLGAGWTR